MTKPLPALHAGQTIAGFVAGCSLTKRILRETQRPKWNPEMSFSWRSSFRRVSVELSSADLSVRARRAEASAHSQRLEPKDFQILTAIHPSSGLASAGLCDGVPLLDARWPR